MLEPVQGSRSEELVGEGHAPFDEVQVGGHDGGPSFIALRDEIMEVLVGG